MGWGDATDPAPPRADGRMPANCTVLPCACVPIKTISIQSLEFVGDHGMLTDYRKDFKTSGNKFPKPEWNEKHAHPMSYSMGQNIEVYLTFQVEPANACPEVGAIFGQGPEGIFFDQTPSMPVFTASVHSPVNTGVHRVVTPFSTEVTTKAEEKWTVKKQFHEERSYLMWSIATATVSFAETGLWLGIGLWGLLVFCAGGIILTALRGYKPDFLTHAAKERQEPVYEQAA